MFNKIYDNKSPFYLFKLQWNLPKADTHGTKKFVRFREVSAWRGFAYFGQKHGKILPQKLQTF